MGRAVSALIALLTWELVDEVATLLLLLLRLLSSCLCLQCALAPLTNLLATTQLRLLALCCLTSLSCRLLTLDLLRLGLLRLGLLRLLAGWSADWCLAGLCLSCEVLSLLLQLLLVRLQCLAAHLVARKQIRTVGQTSSAHSEDGWWSSCMCHW